MKPTALAFFDFDDTLARGDSILPYLLFCVRKGLASPLQLFRAAGGFIRWKLDPSYGSMAKEKALSFIRGRTVEEMDEVARGFFREHTARFYREGQAEIERLRSEGYRVVIVSASNDVYMRVLPEFMPVDAVLSTTCEVVDGRYTGHVGHNCKGDRKPERIAAWLAQQGLAIDQERSAAYGDSPSDALMLLMTGAPVLVNPHRKLVSSVPGGKVVRWGD